MSAFTGAGFEPIQRGSKFADKVYREKLQRGGTPEDGMRHLYATGYVEGGGKVTLSDRDLPVREYNDARRRLLSHGEALDEVLIAGYQQSPDWHASEARRFADEISGL